jgi:hypothetical protein
MKLTLIAGAVLLVGCVTDHLAHAKHDPQEDNPRLRAAFKEADAYAERRTANDPPRLGEVHQYWRFKKEFLYFVNMEYAGKTPLK